jgi:phosphate starvation-inducible PhoH-like protein
MDENVALLSKELGVGINAVGSDLVISGEEEAVDGCLKIIDGAFSLIKREGNLRPYHVKMLLDMLLDSGSVDISGLSDSVAVTDSGRPVKCRTVGQRKYVKAINENGLTFCIGPAGTGKTYLAVARAVTAYRNKEVEKIILTRPAVEAGERLGFLPGDLQQKVDPYLRPLYDALQEMFGFDAYAKMMERGVIEVAPLAYMRGRTLSNAFIILDEAQNTTSEQMKMFLTRMGDGSKMVVTGDTTQIDLPKGVNSGLLQAVNILGAVEGIAVCKLSAKDVVRNSLVQKIVNAYDNYSKKQNK